MFQLGKQSILKKTTALTALSFVAAVSLAACSDTTATEDVNITDTSDGSEQSSPSNTEPAPSLPEPSPESSSPDSPDDGERTETTFTQNQAGVETTMTYIAEGDEVVKQTTTNVVDYAAAGISDETEARELFDPMEDEGQDVDGYEQSIDYGETSATEELEIDYSVADLSELSQLPGYEGTAGAGPNDYISLEESRKMLESSGFEEVE